MIKKLYLAFILIALFTLIGCSQNDTNATVTIGGDYQIGESLESLVENSDIIVLGEYQNLESKWNMARDRHDPEKESTEHYFEGHLYNFKVEESIIGENENDILVNIAYQEQHEYTNEDNQETSFDVIDPYYVEPEIGSTYILFLKKDELFGNYYGSIEPFQIKIHSDNQVELMTNQIVGNDLPEGAEVHDGTIHFKTVGQAQEETIEFITEVSTIENFLEDYNLNQLKSEITNLAK